MVLLDPRSVSLLQNTGPRAKTDVPSGRSTRRADARDDARSPPGVERADVEAAGERAGAVAAEMRREGREVEYVNALLVAGDEVVFHVYRAPDG
jgi:hypothetical protein